MRTTHKINIFRGVLFVLMLTAAIGTRPLSAMAQTNQPEGYMVLFELRYGEFPESEILEGTRFVPAGSTLTDFPPDPIRYGYVFDGWQFVSGERNGQRLEGNSFVVNESIITLEALWVRYGEAPTATPTPTPGTTPTTTPSPTPASSDAGRPNPTTSPIAISVLIFGAVMTLGLAAFGILKLSARQALASGKYRSASARYTREMRLADLLKDEQPQDSAAISRRNARRRRRRSSFYRL